ncbi:hypothetical protein KM043_000511 [Ampulex compressa]|nr:hypothetical protein KM043_000511 [Ampulex compressa]
MVEEVEQEEEEEEEEKLATKPVDPWRGPRPAGNVRLRGESTPRYREWADGPERREESSRVLAPKLRGLPVLRASGRAAALLSPASKIPRSDARWCSESGT